jgi:hypothetical protein
VAAIPVPLKPHGEKGENGRKDKRKILRKDGNVEARK